MNDILDYDELRTLIVGSTYEFPNNERTIKKFESEVAKIIKTQRSRVKLDVFKNEIIIDIRRNRQVGIRFSELFRIQELFKADDIVISSPIRCELKLTLIRRRD